MQSHHGDVVHTSNVNTNNQDDKNTHSKKSKILFSSSSETCLKKNKKNKKREEQKLLIKQFIPPVNTPTRFSADQPLALPPDSKGISMVQVRVRSTSMELNVVNNGSNEPEIEKSLINGKDSRNSNTDSDVITNVAKEEAEDWNWMNEVAADAANNVHATETTNSTTGESMEPIEMQTIEMEEDVLNTKNQMKRLKRLKLGKNQKYLKKKRKKKKKKGSMVPQQELENDLTEPSLTPPTGFFFPPPKLGAGRRLKQLSQLKKQQRMYDRYV